MTRIEVVTYDVGTGHVQVDRSWSVLGVNHKAFTRTCSDAEIVASMFAAEDHSTDHVVYVREV